MVNLSKIRFYKMHGLGNDFVFIPLFDFINSKLTADEFLATTVRNLAHRHIGIGYDQLLLVLPSSQFDCEIVIYNPDGTIANACGNATRCIPVLLQYLGIKREKYTIKIGERTITAALYSSIEQDIAIGLCANSTANMGKCLIQATVCGGIPCFFGNMSNEHLLFAVRNLKEIALDELARIINADRENFPHGINISLVELSEKTSSIFMRTWERGVNAETMACGTAACSAYTMVRFLSAINSGECLQFLFSGGNVKVQSVEHVRVSPNASALIKQSIPNRDIKRFLPPSHLSTLLLGPVFSGLSDVMELDDLLLTGPATLVYEGVIPSLAV